MKLFFLSLGCDKNLVDSEKMLSKLLGGGFTLTDDEAEAEVIVVNTCCFIGDAMEESIQALIDMGRYKTEGNCKVLLAAGCLAGRFPQEIEKELPEVDGIVGPGELGSVLEAIQQSLHGSHPKLLDTVSADEPDTSRVLTTGGHFEYLKIADGCDRRCSYCVIPFIRGAYKSTPIEGLISEARELADKGVRELILVAQDTTEYGVDIYGKRSLPKLLDCLSEIDGIKWIRLMYCYPEDIDDDLIEAIIRNKKVCHYIDMPIQHCSDDILKRMGRHTDYDSLCRTIEHLRELIPDIAIRTTLICGFPGESDEDHAELVDFVKNMRFDRLGAFCYSREENTAAARMPDQIPEDIKASRREEIMLTQQEVSANNNLNMLGREFEVFVEGRLTDQPDTYVGRSYRDAPDVDSYLFFTSSYELISGSFVRVRVTEAGEYDLIGELIDESTK